MFGVLTNYKEWYFVRYDTQKELEAAFEGKPGLTRDCFEVSPVHEILDIKNRVNEVVLGQVIHMI